MSSTVYVVQNQVRYNNASGEMSPRFDTVYKTGIHGEIKHVLSPLAHPFRPHEVMAQLHEHLSHLGPHDWIVPIGAPTLIGMACAVASHYWDGKLRLLHWSSRDREYVEIKCEAW
jgi:hypothetical protein